MSAFDILVFGPHITLPVSLSLPYGRVNGAHRNKLIFSWSHHHVGDPGIKLIHVLPRSFPSHLSLFTRSFAVGGDGVR